MRYALCEGFSWGRKECGWQSGGRNGRHSHGRLRSFSDAKLARWIWRETACSASGRRCDLAGAEPLDRDVQFDNESSTRTATLIHIEYVLRSSLTSHRPKSARRFGTSTSPNGIGQPTFPMTRVGPARRLRSVPRKPGVSLKESAGYIVPVSRSAADQIESLRRQASGRFLSASQPGVFTADSVQTVIGAGRRAFRDTE